MNRKSKPDTPKLRGDIDIKERDGFRRGIWRPPPVTEVGHKKGDDGAIHLHHFKWREEYTSDSLADIYGRKDVGFAQALQEEIFALDAIPIEAALTGGVAPEPQVKEEL